MLVLDHLAVAATDLNAGRVAVEAVLGVPLQAGGSHARYGTHNLLLGLADGVYLEVIAPDPAAPVPAGPRWFDLDRFAGAPRLTNWIARSDDLDADLAALPGSGDAVAMARGDFRWQIAVPADGRLPRDGGQPTLIRWGGAHPMDRLVVQPVTLRRLTICHPQAQALATRVLPLFDDPRLTFETAAAPSLAALFDTPRGLVVL